MGTFFEPYNIACCCLCGSSEFLTGEHKIKASALRKIFGHDSMTVGSFDSKNSLRRAQGPKSRAFHFSARVCAVCNSARTQSPDHEFDRFHTLTSKSLTEGKAPELIFSAPRYSVGSEAYLNVFRYFAKLICCHLAESGGPRPLALSKFALSASDQNHVFLHIDADPTFASYLNKFGEHQFAAHGGLIVSIDSKTKLPTSFRCSVTLGAVRYIFWTSFGPMVGIELRTSYRDFWRKCETAYHETLKNPLSNEERRRLGI